MVTTPGSHRTGAAKSPTRVRSEVVGRRWGIGSPAQQQRGGAPRDEGVALATQDGSLGQGGAPGPTRERGEALRWSFHGDCSL
jgi:hypothetical protein